MSARLGAAVTGHWRRLVVLAVVAAALILSIVSVWPVLFSPVPTSKATTSAAREAVATDLLRTVVGGDRKLFAAHHSFASMSASALSAVSYYVPIVAPSQTAKVGAVSMRVNSANEVTLASPADTGRCVFARDEPRAGGTRFVTERTGACRASAAPAQGWATR